MNRRQCAALVAGLALARPGSAQDRAVVRWKLATGYRAETFHGRNLAQFAVEAAQATQGALAIELHANGALYKLADIWPACEQGQLDAGETIMTSLVKALPIAGADSVPFVVGSYEDARRMWRHQRPLIERQFAARGLEVLYAVPWPPQGLFSTRPVSVSADLKGTRMRTYNQTTVRIAQLLGAVPVDVPMVDVARALAAGRVDTMITSAVTGIGRSVTNCPPTLPVYRCSSSRSRPRGTVLTTSVRAARPSVKNVLSSSGSYLGASCMSCLHAAATHAAKTTNTTRAVTRADPPLQRNF